MRALVLAFAYALWVGGCLYPAYHVAPDGGTAGTAGPGAGAGGGKGGSAAGAAGAGGSGGAAGGAGGGATAGATGSAGVGGASGTGAAGSAGRGGAAGSLAGSGGASAGRGGANGGTGGSAGVGGGSGGRGGSSGLGGSAAGAGGTAAGAGGSAAGAGGSAAGAGGSAAGAGGSNTGKGGGGGGAVGGGAGGGGAGGGTVIQSWTFNVSGDADFNALGLSEADATKTWVASGNPLPGSVQIGFTFTPTVFQLAAGVAYFADLRGVVLSAEVQLVNGFSATYPGYAFMYAKSGAGSLFANGTPVVMTAGSWIRPTMKLDDPGADSGGYATPGYDPSQIVELGVAFEDPTAHATAATVLADTIELTRTP